MSKIRTAIGLMSGTSMDGIDAALIETDGETVSRFGPGLAQEYDENFRDRLRECINRPAVRDDVADMIADRQAAVVLKLLSDNDLAASDVDVIGFHGQTVDHRPEEGVTVQIGNAQRLEILELFPELKTSAGRATYGQSRRTITESEAAGLAF